MFWWGVFDALLAALILPAGFDLLRGGMFGTGTVCEDERCTQLHRSPIRPDR